MAVGFMDAADPCDAAPHVVSHPSRFASEIESRFGERLLRLAKKKLDRRLAARIDEQDVLQSVLRSFFERHAQGQFALESWDDVWGLLVVMTRRKCVKQAQVHFAGCRDVRRDAGIGYETQPQLEWEPSLFPGPTPAELVLLAEASERLFKELSDREKDVLVLALAGRNIEQIGAELGRTQRTVRRLLGRVRERLERMASEAD